MNKKQQPKLSTEADHILSVAEADYRFGNFYEARKLARLLKSSQESSPAQIKRAIDILHMTSLDPLVLGVGCLSLIFTAVVAFWAAY